MRVSVDSATCVGHGRCYVLAPDVFEPDEFGHSIVHCTDTPPELEDQARHGAANCPESAVALEARHVTPVT